MYYLKHFLEHFNYIFWNNADFFIMLSECSSLSGSNDRSKHKSKFPLQLSQMEARGQRRCLGKLPYQASKQAPLQRAPFLQQHPPLQIRETELNWEKISDHLF